MLWHSTTHIEEPGFDVTRAWLPARLSGAEALPGLAPGEAMKLGHLEFGAYIHLLGCLEEFVVPTMLMLGRRLTGTERDASALLAAAATAESTHIARFRSTRSRVNAAVGFALALLPETRRVPSVVLAKHPAAVLLLTACLHAAAEHHARIGVEDDGALDPLARRMLSVYWRDAARPARRVRLETVRAFEELPTEGKDDAIDGFVELVMSVEALLSVQARYDADNLQRYLRCPLDRTAQAEVLDAVTNAKRRALIDSGLAFPTFRELFSLVATRAQRERVEDALEVAMVSLA